MWPRRMIRTCSLWGFRENWARTGFLCTFLGRVKSGFVFFPHMAEESRIYLGTWHEISWNERHSALGESTSPGGSSELKIFKNLILPSLQLYWTPRISLGFSKLNLSSEHESFSWVTSRGRNQHHFRKKCQTDLGKDQGPRDTLVFTITSCFFDWTII